MASRGERKTAAIARIAFILYLLKRFRFAPQIVVDGWRDNGGGDGRAERSGGAIRIQIRRGSDIRCRNWLGSYFYSLEHEYLYVVCVRVVPKEHLPFTFRH